MELKKKRLSLTQATKQWDKEQKAQRERKYEVINGFVYDYPCTKKGHTHTIDCLTQEMIDALSEEAYAQDA